MSDFNGISLGSASIVQLVTIIGSIMVPLAIFGLGLAHNIKKRRREQALQFITQITITEPMVSESHNLYNLLLKFNDQKPTIEDLSVDELKTVMIIGSF